MPLNYFAGVHPDLVERAERIYAALAALGRPMRPSQGVRTAEEQHTLWKAGREFPGAIVTNADGYTKRSNHQVKDDGYGYALDSIFTGDDPYLRRDPRGELWWGVYGACIRAVGCVWGGDWASILDRPHMELPHLPPSKG